MVLRFENFTTTVTVNVTGMVSAGSTGTGTIGNWRLYEDNGAGGLGTYLAATSSEGLAGGAAGVTSTGFADSGYQTDGGIDLVFGPANDQNSLLDSFCLAEHCSYLHRYCRHLICGQRQDDP